MSAQDGERHSTEWKEEKELDPSMSDVERKLLELYDNLSSPTTSSLTQEERQLAERTASSYLFGEVLPAGVSKMLDEDHLDAASARVMFDLGMGCGRLCMQAFLQFVNLREVVGVELSSSRTSVAMEAMERLYEQVEDDGKAVWQLEMSTRPPYSTLTATNRKTIKQRRETEQARWLDLVHLVDSFKVGCRILTYNRLEDIYASVQKPALDESSPADHIVFPWRKLPDRYGEDHFAASWGNARFYIYRKVM